ncbi:MAG: type I DNA topoisomerase [Candidatus Paceibacterota bacterium]|jgi:DNA topoisomerase-1
MKLVIVESPAKAKTIEKYLKGEYKVRASVGHIRDLPKSNKKAIDIPGGFIPHYEISKAKTEIVEELIKLSKKADEVLLATDPDREGEAIAWHIKEACNLENPKRVVFHEITEPAILEAMQHPRDIDENLRKAQEARRVLDRLVGYDLSGLIWKKVRYGLSAGRVQSPALRIIMEREREIRAFIPEHFWVIKAKCRTDKYELELTCEDEPKKEQEVERILSAARTHPWHIISVKKTEAKRSPKPPFITSTLQQAASSRLGYSPSRTMGIAQKLYEAGFITYMRTDSVNLSSVALAEMYKEIEKTYGKEYLSPRTYITKSKNAQEAHEAIRPTKMALHSAGGNDEQKRLYELIWQRTLASQMTDAQLLRTKIVAEAKGAEIPFFSMTGNIVIFPGWLMADTGARGEERELPHLEKDEVLTLVSIESEGKETEPLPRYTEAGLVKELEKREIGRPSTYAAIIRTLDERGYIEKQNKTLHPTDTGEVVSDFLEKNFANYISDSFTAEMENKLDEIAEGKKEYKKVLKDFYIPFAKEVKEKEKLEKATTLGEDTRFTCPLDPSHGTMVIKLGRAGKFLSCRLFDEKDKAKQCKGARKLDGTLMEGPKETGELCPDCGGKLLEREGRFGKFIACSNWSRGKKGCHYIKQSPEEEAKKRTGVKCPLDNGDIIERRGRFGAFFSCSNYPSCKFIMKSRPTGNKCNLCDSLMMEGTKTIPERCSNKACINHNPHKIKK